MSKNSNAATIVNAQLSNDKAKQRHAQHRNAKQQQSYKRRQKSGTSSIFAARVNRSVGRDKRNRLRQVIEEIGLQEVNLSSHSWCRILRHA